MKILFTAPRFHTNQVPIVKGLIEKGHEVGYFVTFIGAIEDHSLCKPIVLKPSEYTTREKKRLSRTDSESNTESIIAGHFIPDQNMLIDVFVSFMPDVVICREKTNLTLHVHSLCQEHKIPCILYDQNPVYPIKIKTGYENNARCFLEGFRKRIEKRINADLRRSYRLRAEIGFPITRMTPVEYEKLPRSLSLKKPLGNTFYIPFVAERYPEAIGREYCKDGICRFLCIGKFRDYKNLKLIVEAAALVNKGKKWMISLVGQVSNHDEQEYYEMICNMIKELQLTDRFQIKTNIPHDQIGKEYLEHDIFVLPSKREKASISILEAMSYGLPVISTDYNGTASYIIEGETGFIFPSENSTALADRMEEIMEADIRTVGRKALEEAQTHYSFENYYKRFQRMLDEGINGKQEP